MRPTRKVSLGPRDVEVERRADGAILLRSPHPLSAYPAKLTERLEHWAARAPQRILLAQRDAAGGWRTMTYEQALQRAREARTASRALSCSRSRPCSMPGK